MGISVVISAYNEEKNISEAVRAFTKIDRIDEIIVIDNGSKDKTSEIVKKFKEIKLIRLEKNIGKTKAILKGVEAAKNETLLFSDADLIGLKKEYVEDLINKYREGYDLVIMQKGAQPWVFRVLLKSIPAVSSTRIFYKKDLNNIDFEDARSFDLELRINDYFLSHNKKIAVVPAPTLRDPRKYVKYPFLIGLVLDIKSGLEILTTNGVLGIPKFLRQCWEIYGIYKNPK